MADMPYDNSESKTRKSRPRHAMNLVVAGAVAVAPVAACDTAAKPTADAAAQMDATGSPDKPDAGAEMAAALDSNPATDAGDDAEDDAALDAYPDGIRG